VWRKHWNRCPRSSSRTLKALSIQLRRMLRQVTDHYDYVFIDCARRIDIMSINALAAATDVIAPIDGDPMAVAGLGQIRQSLLELAEAEVISASAPFHPHDETQAAKPLSVQRSRDDRGSRRGSSPVFGAANIPQTGDRGERAR